MSSRPQRSSTSPARSTAARGRPVQGRRNMRWIWAIAALALIVVAGGAALLLRRPSLAGVTTFSDLSRDHVETKVTYPQTPPVGGAHNGGWQNCGIYDKPVQNEYAVHSLEHGAVWITYQPDLPAADVERLRNLARGHTHVLLSPYPGLPARVVATAWGVQMQADSASDPRLPAFIARYERGPQTPEANASCRRGVGTPIDR